jgi:hypothetical protein
MQIGNISLQLADFRRRSFQQARPLDLAGALVNSNGVNACIERKELEDHKNDADFLNDFEKHRRTEVPVRRISSVACLTRARSRRRRKPIRNRLGHDAAQQSVESAWRHDRLRARASSAHS